MYRLLTYCCMAASTWFIGERHHESALGLLTYAVICALWEINDTIRNTGTPHD